MGNDIDLSKLKMGFQEFSDIKIIVGLREVGKLYKVKNDKLGSPIRMDGYWGSSKPPWSLEELFGGYGWIYEELKRLPDSKWMGSWERAEFHQVSIPEIRFFKLTRNVDSGAFGQGLWWVLSAYLEDKSYVILSWDHGDNLSRTIVYNRELYVQWANFNDPEERIFDWPPRKDEKLILAESDEYTIPRDFFEEEIELLIEKEYNSINYNIREAKRSRASWGNSNLDQIIARGSVVCCSECGRPVQTES